MEKLMQDQKKKKEIVGTVKAQLVQPNLIGTRPDQNSQARIFVTDLGNYLVFLFVWLVVFFFFDCFLINYSFPSIST